MTPVYELTNTAWRKAKKHPDRAAAIRAGLQRALADDMAIVWSDVEPDGVLDLALEMDLTACDASYLWLARHLQAELVTLDTDWPRLPAAQPRKTERGSSRRLSPSVGSSFIRRN